ncbi:putative phosphoesterase [Phaeomoniella chlamydospora]|uniref:Putative phosphoesterase n=1 Tax=Phaeomoniella chlamydospora TaxID=158046 RepID=A0A0G2ES68_PHACM|nr:putative phosphoesterase [Phaeomoniella chlamydospora]
MNKRIIRTFVQLGTLAALVLFGLFLLDNTFNVLPASIHNRLPAHHTGTVITDITVTTCSSVNIFGSCKLDSDSWHRVEKDLYLGKGFLSKAYIHVQRKKEEDLLPTDKVVLDIKIGRLGPAESQTSKDDRWESRPAGVWIKKSSKRHVSDTVKAVTAVDVLFGADAVDPRPGWTVQDIPLLLDANTEAMEARLSVRHGPHQKVEKSVPRIRKDGKFKIMQLADLHLSTGLGHCRDAMPANLDDGRCDADIRTLEFVEKMIADEKPDFIAMTGDQVNGDTAPDAQSAFYKIADVCKRHQIPYAAIFGNHDDEGDLDRANTMVLMQDLPYSMSEAGPEDIDGIGNYVVEILGRAPTSHAALSLYMLDTHSYSPDERQFRGYDWLKPNQISWFHDKAQSLKRKHKEYTHIHMDLAFIHIPLPEYRNPDGYQIVGNWTEAPTAPGFNSGFKDALVEEGVVMVSCGHDHVNDYCVPGSSSSKSDKAHPAIWMCYGGGVGFGGYGGYYGYHRRIRFFDIDMNTARITTYKRLEWGDTDKRLDEQMIVDGGKVIVHQQ